MAAAGAKSRRRAPRLGAIEDVRPLWTMTVSPLGTYRRRNTHTAPSSKAPASMTKPA